MELFDVHQSLTIGRPSAPWAPDIGTVTVREKTVLVRIKKLPRLLPIGSHQACLAVTILALVCREGDRSPIRRNAPSCGIVAQLSGSPTHHRERPGTVALPVYARVRQKPGAVREPANAPVHLAAFESLRLRKSLYVAGGNELDVNPLQVGIGQILAVGRNGAGHHRIITAVGGELTLLQLRPGGRLTGGKPEDGAGDQR